jgi:hypothetical protein
MSRLSIPSCGLSLLQGPLDAFDYVLWLTDGEQQIKVLAHRCVLLAHSEKMRELITGENFFECTIKVKPGYLTACLELLQFMYMKDPRLIHHVDQVLELCGMFRMPYDHIAIRDEKLEPTDVYVTVELQLEPQSHALTMCTEFFQRLVLPEIRLKRQAKPPETKLQAKPPETKLQATPQPRSPECKSKPLKHKQRWKPMTRSRCKRSRFR